MGQPHNRKRTRSRPRTKNPNFVRDYSSFTYSRDHSPPLIDPSYMISTSSSRPGRSDSIISTSSMSSISSAPGRDLHAWSDSRQTTPTQADFPPLSLPQASTNSNYRSIPSASIPTAPRAWHTGTAGMTNTANIPLSKRQQRKLSGDHKEASAAKRRRIFGSDSGDEEGELCGPMLKVVFDLFEGYDFDC
ncbi:Hypothetical protein D9617_26g078950 [Elsinoe fawcettii]|nr:Hypothetical protein D9617_26g078950 [Elsinoe fawcettii]